jgi:hypothetical protein
MQTRWVARQPITLPHVIAVTGDVPVKRANVAVRARAYLPSSQAA